MSVCGRCGATFGCAMADGAADGAPCWCTALPALLPVPAGAGAAGASTSCWCPACLRAEIERRQAGGAAAADSADSAQPSVPAAAARPRQG